ncbi:LEA type 2 family protein [Bdellovibrio sp. ArHS]|uniref:LEA type 2 family protein n=1 Tax=Bdellovibrio sp. ArHS TaxID=1569284 RepID=UPI000B0F8626|nr:LEA type 2 family protein [Bdellovibrio sp. ArHS]
MTSRLLVALFLTALSACSGKGLLGLAEKPEAKLQSVYAKDTNLSGTTLVFVVNVQNPNRFAIEVEEVAYKVYIGDKQLTTAKTNSAIKIPAAQDANIELPLPVKYGDLMGHLGSILTQGELPYKIEGDAKFSFATIPFTKEGKVELR